MKLKIIKKTIIEKGVNNESIRPSYTEFEIEQYVEESENRTRTQITTLKKDINQIDRKIDSIFINKEFCANSLYNLKSQKELLERQIEGLNKIMKELF